MATFDLDPLFLKGLRLLHSKAKDSADQLRQLLDDVLSHKHSASLSSIPARDSKGFVTVHRLEGDKNNGSKKGSPRHSNESSSQSSKSSITDEPKKKEAEKRQFEKLNKELSELFDFESKRPRLLAESPRSSLSSSPSPQPAALKIEEQASAVTVSMKSEFMDSIAMLAATGSGGPTDAEDFAIEMGLVCIVCKQLEATSRNQLIECQECHSLYHQECHRPPVTDTEVNDPRHVWYCIRCTKTMRKASKTQKPSSKSGSTAVNLRETVISTKNQKITEIPSPTTPSLLPFKRSEIKTSGVTQGSSTSHGSNLLSTSNKPTGLASLAANFSNRTPITSTTSSSTKTGFGSKGGLSSLANSSKLSSSFSSLASSNVVKVGKAVPSGLVGLAASVSAKSASVPPRSLATTSTSGGASSTSSVSGNGGNAGKSSSTSSSLMSADKRLQIMKKKAAQKMQEKRRLSSK